MAFITQAVTVLQTLVIALGAGLAVWGVVNLMEGYLGWRDDVKAAREGQKVMRVVDGKGGSRFIVQILPYGFEDKKPFGYVILIQTVEKKRRAEE